MAQSHTPNVPKLPTGAFFRKGALILLGVFALQLPVLAKDTPEITPSLKNLLGGLPIDGLQGQVKGMIASLKETSCASNLTGCYMTQSGSLQLYFFTSGAMQQTLLLVANKDMKLPHLLGEKVQKVMGETTISSPMISLSTTDYQLDTIKMPPALQAVVREKYFNVDYLEFSSGVQMAARAELGGALRLAMQSMGANVKNMMMRAAVVMPIPLDLTSAAGTGAGVADAAAHGQKMQDASKDALKPEAFVEFQFGPGSVITMGMPQMNLTDATFFLNNALTFGYKGNATYKGAEDRKVITQFQTPLAPSGVMDLADFKFAMATPAEFTLKDASNVMIAMATPDPRLSKSGGFIKGIDKFQGALKSMTNPLSVVKFRNPVPPPPYVFGDKNKPFPTDSKYFNFRILGPLSSGGPIMYAAGDMNIMGQTMGWMEAIAGLGGLEGEVGQKLNLKMGPLGRLNVSFVQSIKITPERQVMIMTGNVAGQQVEISQGPLSMSIAMNASCVNPFKLEAEVAIVPSLNLSDVFDAQAGISVDPSKITGCIGKDLEAAYNKIANEYKTLSGFTSDMANTELTKIANVAAAEAKAEYDRAKKEARKVAESSINAVSKTFSGGSGTVVRAAGGSTSKPSIDIKTMLYDRSVFDWDYVYDDQPDLVKKKTDLVTYWQVKGYMNLQRGSREFDIKFYRDRNPDYVIFKGAENDPDMITMHWLTTGVKEGRQSSPDFDITAYVNRYSDLQKAYGTNYAAALAHWFDSGKAEGRDPSPEPPKQFNKKLSSGPKKAY